MNMNIMISKKIDILVFHFKTLIDNYQIFIFIEIRIKKGRAITHFIHIKKFIIILAHFETHIFIHYVFLSNRDFFFELN